VSRLEAAAHMDALFGEDEGFVGLASGDLDAKRHAERQFRWPQEREAAMAWVVAQVGLKRDVYVSPGLLRAMRRKAETALSARCCWCDLDQPTADTLAYWRSLPGFVLVESSPGRYHGYVRFDQSIPADEVKALNPFDTCGLIRLKRRAYQLRLNAARGWHSRTRDGKAGVPWAR